MPDRGPRHATACDDVEHESYRWRDRSAAANRRTRCPLAAAPRGARRRGMGRTRAARARGCPAWADLDRRGPEAVLRGRISIGAGPRLPCVGGSRSARARGCPAWADLDLRSPRERGTVYRPSGAHARDDHPLCGAPVTHESAAWAPHRDAAGIVTPLARCPAFTTRALVNTAPGAEAEAARSGGGHPVGGRCRSVGDSGVPPASGSPPTMLPGVSIRPIGPGGRPAPSADRSWRQSVRLAMARSA